LALAEIVIEEAINENGTVIHVLEQHESIKEIVNRCNVHKAQNYGGWLTTTLDRKYKLQQL
jgi:hypothetical protein